MAKKHLTPYEQLQAACRAPDEIIAWQKQDPKTNNWYVLVDHEDDEPYMTNRFESAIDPKDEVLLGPVTKFEAECGLQREFSLRGE